LTIRNKAEEYLYGPMARNTKENGPMASNMGEESLQLTLTRKNIIGKMARSQNKSCRKLDYN
jgi:hypothetical protein